MQTGTGKAALRPPPLLFLTYPWRFRVETPKTSPLSKLIGSYRRAARKHIIEQKFVSLFDTLFECRSYGVRSIFFIIHFHAGTQWDFSLNAVFERNDEMGRVFSRPQNFRKQIRWQFHLGLPATETNIRHKARARFTSQT